MASLNHNHPTDCGCPICCGAACQWCGSYNCPYLAGADCPTLDALQEAAAQETMSEMGWRQVSDTGDDALEREGRHLHRFGGASDPLKEKFPTE